MTAPLKISMKWIRNGLCVRACVRACLTDILCCLCAVGPSWHGKGAELHCQCCWNHRCKFPCQVCRVHKKLQSSASNWQCVSASVCVCVCVSVKLHLLWTLSCYCEELSKDQIWELRVFFLCGLNKTYTERENIAVKREKTKTKINMSMLKY